MQGIVPMLTSSVRGVTGGMDTSATAQLTWLEVNWITMTIPMTGTIIWQTDELGNWGISP